MGSNEHQTNRETAETSLPVNVERGMDGVMSDLTSDVRSAVQNDVASEKLDYHEAFSSERFISAIREVPIKARKEAIGRTLQYAVLHPDGFMFWDFIDTLKNIKYDRLFGNLDSSDLTGRLLATIQRKLGLEEVESMGAKEKILRYCEKHLHENGCNFHGFNGVFEQDIREKGLTLNERQWDWGELRRMHDICSKAGNEMAFGWALINCENKLSFSTLPRATYTYATNSPEWFSIFTSQGTHIPFENGRRKAFASRNYDLARSNVELFCDTMMSSKPEDIAARKAYPNITPEERQEILDFFEKHWKKFASAESHPCVALIKNKAADVLDDGQWEQWSAIRIKTRMENLAAKSAKEIVAYAMAGEVDARCEHDIAKEDIEIFRLPDYSQLYPEELSLHPV